MKGNEVRDKWVGFPRDNIPNSETPEDLRFKARFEVRKLHSAKNGQKRPKLRIYV